MKQYSQNIPAAYLILIKENKILLLRRFNTGYEDGNYSFIAGHVEKGESFIECIIRETKEEANIEITKKDLKTVHIMHRKSMDNNYPDRIDTFILATKWKGEIKNNEPNKCDDLSWFDLDNLPKNTINYIKQAIENIKKNNFYSEFGFDK